MRIARIDAQPERDVLDRLDRVALRLCLVADPAQVPGLVRQRDDAGHGAQRVLLAAAAEQARERPLISPPDALQTTTARGGEARLVVGVAVLVEVDPAGIRRDLDHSRPEAWTADVHVAQGDLARDVGETVLVLLPAHEEPGREEHQGNQEDEGDSHHSIIGGVRFPP